MSARPGSASESAAMAAICRREVIKSKGPVNPRRSAQHLCLGVLKGVVGQFAHSTQHSTSRRKSAMFGLRAGELADKASGKCAGVGVQARDIKARNDAGVHELEFRVDPLESAGEDHGGGCAADLGLGRDV